MCDVCVCVCHVCVFVCRLELCKVEVQMAHVCELCEELKQEEQEKQHRKQDRHLLQEKTSSRAHRRTIQQSLPP